MIQSEAVKDHILHLSWDLNVVLHAQFEFLAFHRIPLSTLLNLNFDPK